MSKTGKLIVWGIVAILIIWWISSSSSKKSATIETSDTGAIKIGAILPLTGDAAVYGEPGRNVIELAIKEINTAGGVNGRQLQLITEDGKCAGESAASAAQKLVNVDKVQVIIGGFCSGESLAAEPITTAAQVFLFSPASSSPDLTGKSAFFARDYPSDSTQGKVLAGLSADKQWKKVAVIQEQTDYASGIYKSFSENFSALGGTVTKEEFATGTTDFRSILTKLKSENPGALLVDVQTPANAQRIFKQMADLKWKLPLMSSDVVLSDTETVNANKSILEGSFGAEFNTDPTNATFQHLLGAYKNAYNADLPFQSYGQTEYDSVYILKAGLMAVGNDGKKLADWVHNLKDFMGASGNITIGQSGDIAGGHVLVTMKNGEVVRYQK
jgi:branched-chain amino acid transport system substrate-binding protein